MLPQFAYSFDRHSYTGPFNSRQEAIAAGIKRSREIGAAGESYEGYLTRVTEQQEAELDATLEQCSLGWLKKHELMPQFTKVRGVSEHPIPGEAVVGRNGASDEVRVGTSDYQVG